MILAAIYPEKFEGEKGQNLMKVSSLNFDPLPGKKGQPFQQTSYLTN